MFSDTELRIGVEFSKEFRSHDGTSAYEKLATYQLIDDENNDRKLKCLDEFCLFDEDNVEDNINFKFDLEKVINSGSCYGLSCYIVELIQFIRSS